MPKPVLDVLYEDNHLLVVNKPVGLATQGVAEGTPSVITQAKEFLKRKHKKTSKRKYKKSSKKSGKRKYKKSSKKSGKRKSHR